MVVGVILGDILAKTISVLFHTRSMVEHTERSNAVTSVSNNLWHSRWVECTKRRWTHKLSSNITVWFEQKYGEVNYYTAQFLMGHGG